MGERALTKFQAGKETDRGTAVAADTILLIGEHPPINVDRVPTPINDDAGVRAPSVRAPRVDQFLVNDTLTNENTYFQYLPLMLSLGVKGNITPVEQNPSEADWLWTFTPSMTALNAPDTATFEMGDDTQAYEVEYVMISRIRFAGTISQDQSASNFIVEISYFGRQVTPTTFTGALNIPSTENINSKLMRFFQDTTFAGLGGTEKTGLLRAWDIEILTGNHPKFHGGVNKFFDVHGEGQFEIMARLTLEGNSDADAIYDQFQTNTQTFLEFNVSGAQIGAGVNHNLTLGIGGFWEDVRPLSENALGNNLHTALLHSTYDPTGAQVFALAVTTDVAAI